MFKRKGARAMSLPDRMRDELWTSLMQDIREAGGTDEDISWLQTAEGAWFRKEFAARVVAKVSGSARDDEDAKLWRLIALGRYGWVHEEVSIKRFPLELDDTAENLELLQFREPMLTARVLQEITTSGYRPAKLRGLLKHGMRNNTASHEDPIVALGSVWSRFDGERLCPYISHGPAGRSLSLIRCGLGETWAPCYRFLVIRV